MMKMCQGGRNTSELAFLLRDQKRNKPPLSCELHFRTGFQSEHKDANTSIAPTVKISHKHSLHLADVQSVRNNNDCQHNRILKRAAGMGRWDLCAVCVSFLPSTCTQGALGTEDPKSRLSTARFQLVRFSVQSALYHTHTNRGFQALNFI